MPQENGSPVDSSRGLCHRTESGGGWTTHEHSQTGRGDHKRRQGQSEYLGTVQASHMFFIRRACTLIGCYGKGCDDTKITKNALSLTLQMCSVSGFVRMLLTRRIFNESWVCGDPIVFPIRYSVSDAACLPSSSVMTWSSDAGPPAPAVGM